MSDGHNNRQSIDDHIVQRDTECEFCGQEMPKGFPALEDFMGRLYCSYQCFEDDSDDDDDDQEETDSDIIIV